MSLSASACMCSTTVCASSAMRSRSSSVNPSMVFMKVLLPISLYTPPFWRSRRTMASASAAFSGR